jgi:tetratricopeptide (TPR) repeat protein
MSDFARKSALLAFVLNLAVVASHATEERDSANFVAPSSLSPAAAAQYKKAVAAYDNACDEKAGQAEKKAAIQELKRTRNLAPKFAAPSYYMGVLHQAGKEYSKARQALREACALNPGFQEAMVALGDVALELGQAENALAEYGRAIAVSPSYGRAYAKRGYARLRTGDYKAAVQDLEQAKEQGDSDPAIDSAIAAANREISGPGWALTFASETDHYRVESPVSQEFSDGVAKDAELIFKMYTKVFPRAAKPRRKLPIMVFRSREDYEAAGGVPRTGGAYDPFVRKLVLYRHTDDEITRRMLYHEGFHQFLHDDLEGAPPWFNEGMADFFGASRPVATKGSTHPSSMEIRPHPTRLETVLAAIRDGKAHKFEHLMLMNQSRFVKATCAAIHPAQSWSIVYFLVRGGARPGAETGPHWKLLQDYQKALRAGDGSAMAFDAAFAKVDLAKLEREWSQCVQGLKGAE